jgi:hypothetical protein
MAFDDEERKRIGGFGFLTLKPVLIVLNLGDEGGDASTMVKYDYGKAQHIGIQAALESELSVLDDDDKAMFMEEYGITELSADRVIEASYSLLGIHSFLTRAKKKFAHGVSLWGRVLLMPQVLSIRIFKKASSVPKSSLMMNSRRQVVNAMPKRRQNAPRKQGIYRQRWRCDCFPS